MLKSIITVNKHGEPLVSQSIIVECDNCHKEYSVQYRHFIKQLEKRNKSLCFKCSRTSPMRGKKHSEETRKKISVANKGKLWSTEREADRLRASNSLSTYNRSTKGLTLEERLGVEKARLLRESRSFRVLGDKNPMFGKPCPITGVRHIGVQGWYGNWFFRSILELSFRINILEAQKIEFISCDQDISFRIPYYDSEGNRRNYFPDFFLKEEKTVIEIKPYRMSFLGKNVSEKTKAGEQWCKEKGYVYKLLTEKDFNRLTPIRFEELIAQGRVVLSKLKF